MMSEEAKNTFYTNIIWTRYVIAFLGIWLLTVAFSFHYTNSFLWWSDLFAGLALLASAVYALMGRNEFSPWDSCIIGLWLLSAPVLFWAPEAFIYLNDTAIGILALAFGCLIPGVPEDVLREGNKTPPAWSYNPSSWMQRLPIIAFAICGWLSSFYMAGYQFGYRDEAGFLSLGTVKILESSQEKIFSLADAGFTALTFLLIAALACMGSIRRWHSIPWVVGVFGGLAILLGFSNALFVLLQPLISGEWCGWCLLTAVCSLAILILAVDEIIAVIVYLIEIHQAGKPVWQVFWQGDGGLNKEHKELPSQSVSESLSFPEMFRGVDFSWIQAVCALIGVLILATEHAFVMGLSSLSVIHSLGSLIVIISILAFAEIISTIRYLNVLLAVILTIYAWITSELSLSGSLFYTLAAGGLIALSLWKREVKEGYGQADKLIL